MEESAHILANVKLALKARGVTYAELARRIGLSETSVKRVLSRGTLSLRRLEQICAALGTGIAEVVHLRGDSETSRTETLTVEQEKALAMDTKLFACYHLVANGRSCREIGIELNVAQRAVLDLLARLKSLGLVTQTTKNRARAATTVAVKWRADGPVRRMYEREVRAEFLQSLFGTDRDAFHFRSAELSAASCKVLQRKLDRLAAEFRELAELDGALPSTAKRNVGCLLAMRPWISSWFANTASGPAKARRARV